MSPAPPSPAGCSSPRTRPLIRLDIVETLTDAGYEIVAEAADGEEAVRLADEHAPDLCVLDVKMPVMDGITAAERISRSTTAPSSC